MANSLIHGQGGAIPPEPVDTRVWRYRSAADGKVEEKLFARLEDVPDGEGWVANPGLVVPVEAEKPKPKKAKDGDSN